MSGTTSTATYTSYEGKDGRPMTKQQLVEYFKGTSADKAAGVSKKTGVFDKTLPELRPMKHEILKFNQNDLNKALSEYKIKTLKPEDRLQQFPLSFEFVSLKTDNDWVPQFQEGVAELFSYVKTKEGGQRLSITWKPDWTEDGAIMAKFFAGMPIYDSATGVVPTYTPTYKVMKYDADFVAAFRNKLLSASFTDYEIQDAFECYSEMVYAVNNYSFNNGTLFGQMGRLAAVEDRAKFAKPVVYDYEQYKVIMDRMFKLTPVPKKTHWDSNIKRIIDELSEGTRDGWAPMTTNLDADDGLLHSKNGRMFKKADCIVQDFITASMVIKSMGTELESKMLSTSRLFPLKNKGEVYANADRKKKTRNIFPGQNGTQIPQMMLYNSAHYEHVPWDPSEGSITLSGFSPWYGGMHNLLLDVIARVEKLGYAFLVYADNLYLCYEPNMQGTLGYEPDSELKELVWISLDGSKMESAITPDLVEFENRRMIDALKEAGHTFSDQYESYSTGFYPIVACRGVAVIGGAQLPLNQMGSGTIGTFAYNNAKMSLLVHSMMEKMYMMYIDRPGQGSYNAQGKFIGPLSFITPKEGGYKFEPWFQGCMDEVGVTLTVESVVTGLRAKMLTPGSILALDLLGFNGIVTRTSPEGNRVLPILDQSRFFKTLVLPKSDSFFATDKLKRFTTRLVRSISLIVLGAWYRPSLFKVIRRRILNEFKSLVGAAKLSDMTSEALIEAIQVNLSDYEDEHVKPLISKLLEDKDNFLMPSMVRILQLVGFNDPEFLVYILEHQGVQPNLMLSESESRQMGIKLAPITQPERFKEPIDLSYFISLKRADVKPPTPLVATEVVAKEIYRDVKVKADPTRVLKISEQLLRIFGKGVVVHFIVPILPRYRYNLNSITNINAFLQTAFFAEFAGQFSLRTEDLIETAKKISHAVRLHLHYDKDKPTGHKLIDGVWNISGPGEYFFSQIGNYTHDLFIKTGSMFSPVIDVDWYEDMGVDWSDLVQYWKGNHKIPLDLTANEGLFKNKKRGPTKAIVREYAWGKAPMTNKEIRSVTPAPAPKVDKRKVDTAQALVPKPKPKITTQTTSQFAAVPSKSQQKQYGPRKVEKQEGGSRDVVSEYKKPKKPKPTKDVALENTAALDAIMDALDRKDIMAAFRMAQNIPKEKIDEQVETVQRLADNARKFATQTIEATTDQAVKLHYKQDFNSTFGRLNSMLKKGLSGYPIK